MMNNKAYLFLIGILFLAMTACGGGASPGANPGAGAGSPGGANLGAGADSPGGASPGAGAGSLGGANSGAGGPGGKVGPGGAGPADAAIPVGGSGGVEMPDMDMGDLPIDENGNISISVTDEQANEMLAAQSAQSTETSQIEDAEISFTTAGIVFTGNVSGQALYILFWPYAENGTIQIDVVEATLGGMDVPAALLDEAETAVNQNLSSAMGSVDAITLQSIVVTDGLLTITGSLNG